MCPQLSAILYAMLKTSARALRLLVHTAGAPRMVGEELSDRLAVDVRTIRRDVDRLRELGYVIDASAGPGGGYRLGSGQRRPRYSSTMTRLLRSPSHSARQPECGEHDDVGAACARQDRPVVPAAPPAPAERASRGDGLAGQPPFGRQPECAGRIAAACRDQVQLRFWYRDNRGVVTGRIVEPMRLVHTGRRWYLAAWDVGAALGAPSASIASSRILVSPKGRASSRGSRPRFRHLGLPIDCGVPVSVSSAPASDRLGCGGTYQTPPWIGVLEPLDDNHCVLTTGGDTYETIAALIVASAWSSRCRTAGAGTAHS